MPAPTNDLFISATPISGVEGEISGANTGATAEAGEPANAGRTVWYRWTAPVELSPVVPGTPPSPGNPGSPGYGGRRIRRVFFFSTRHHHGSTRNPAAPLKTVLQIFTGTSLGDLTEITYFAESQPRNFAGWEYGSQVQFSPEPEQNYYIRVDGDGGAQGDFLLWWGKFRLQAINPCEERPLNLGVGEVCAAVLNLGDGFFFGVQTEQFPQSFGSHLQGNYVVHFIRGAWLSYEPGMRWSTIPPLGNFDWQQIWIDIPGRRLEFSANREERLTYVEAEYLNLCAETRWHHPGGDVTLYFYDPGRENANANFIDATYQNPMFALYRVTPVFQEAGASVFWSSGNRFRGTFKIQNLTRSDWSGITVTMLAQGNIASPSAPVNFAVNALQTAATAEFQFDITPAGNTAAQVTLRLNNGGLDTFRDMTWDITPVIQLTLLHIIPNGFCGGSAVVGTTFGLSNSGFCQTRDLKATITPLSGADRIYDTSCGVTNVISPFDQIYPLGGGALAFIFRPQPATNHNVKVRLQLSDGPVNHGTFEFDLTF